MAAPIIPGGITSALGNNPLTLSSGGVKCRAWLVQNNSATPIQIEEDTTATAGSFEVAANGGYVTRSMIKPDGSQAPATTLNIWTPAAGTSINGTSRLGVVVRGWEN